MTRRLDSILLFPKVCSAEHEFLYMHWNRKVSVVEYVWNLLCIPLLRDANHTFACFFQRASRSTSVSDFKNLSFINFIYYFLVTSVDILGNLIWEIVLQAKENPLLLSTLCKSCSSSSRQVYTVCSALLLTSSESQPCLFFFFFFFFL